MSIYDDLSKEGFTEQEIRDAVLEENSNVVSQLANEDFTPEEIFGAITEESGIPYSSFGIGESTATPPKVVEAPTPIDSKTTQEPINKNTDVTVDNGMKDFKTYLKVKLAQGEIDRAGYDAELSKKMKENVKVTGIQSVSDMYNRESNETKVSKALANAAVLRQDGSPTAYVTDAMKKIISGKIDSESEKIALEYLAKNDLISYYKEGKVTMKDGSIIPLESAFTDVMVANANSIMGSIFGGITGAISGTAESPIGGTILGAKLGSAAGAGVGAAQDFNRASKFLGVDYNAEDMTRAVSVASADDLMFSAIASKISSMNLVEKISDKAIRLKNAFVNNDIDGAWKTYKETTNLSEDELDTILEQGSKLRGIEVPNLSTTEGKKKAFEMVAMYDDTISGQIISAAKLNPQAISNAGRNLYNNTESIKKLIQADDIKSIDEIAKLNKESIRIYGEMKKSFSNAFDGVPIDFNSLKNKFSNTLAILDENKSGFNESLQKRIAAFTNKADGLESIDDLIQLNKDYNLLMRKLKGSNVLNDTQYKTIGKGKNDIMDDLFTKISNNPALKSEDKQNLMSAFTNSNFSVQEINKIIDTDLFSAVTSKRGNIKENNKILDTIIAKAKEGSTKGELDDATKLLGALDNDQYQALEKNIINRIVSKSAIDGKGLITDFSKVMPELNAVSHIFKTDASKQTIETIGKYSALINNDNILHFVASLQPEAKISASGMSTDFTMKTPIEQASVRRLFGRVQVIAPTIFRELGIDGLTNALPLFKAWTGASREMGLKLNLVDGLSRAKDVPSFFTELLATQGDNISQPARNGIKDFLSDYAKVNVILQNIPVAERLRLQQQVEAKKASAITAEEIPSNMKELPSPEKEIIDTEATRNYTKGTDDRYFDEFGNMYNNKNEIPSSTTPIPTGIENKSSAKKPLDTTIVAVAKNKDAYKEDIIQESYSKGFKSSDDITKENMKGKEIVPVVINKKPKGLTEEQTKRYDDVMNNSINPIKKEIERIGRAMNQVSKQNTTTAKKSKMNKEYATQLRKLNADLVEANKKLPKK